MLQLETGAPSPPSQCVWSGLLLRSKPVLAVAWEDPPLLLLVDVEGSHRWLSFAEKGPLALHSEVDGIRIVSAAGADLIQHTMTSPAAQQLCRSAEAGSSPYPAAAESVGEADGDAEAMAEGKEECGHLREIEAIGLERAVVDCLRAAAARFVPAQQQPFLQAARVGHRRLAAMPGGPSERLLRDMAQQYQRLRLLNEVRRADVGMPLSEAQFEFLGESVLIARLVRRGLFELSCRVCQFLQRPATLQSILLQWAEGLLQRTSHDAIAEAARQKDHNQRQKKKKMPASDAQILARLRGQLQKKRYGFEGYSSVAVLAARHGRPGLVRPLLRYEKKPAPRVGALLAVADAAAEAAGGWGRDEGESEDDGFLREGVYALDGRGGDGDGGDEDEKGSDGDGGGGGGMVLPSGSPRRGDVSSRGAFTAQSWYTAALAEAMEADDTQLAVVTLLHLKEKLDDEFLFPLVTRAGRPAEGLLLNALRQTGKLNDMHRLLLHMREYGAAAEMFVSKAHSSDRDKQILLLAHARKLCSEHTGSPGSKSDADVSIASLADAFEQQIRLVKMQRDWMPRLQGKPLVETVVSLLARSTASAGEEGKLAASIRQQFEISDRRWYRMQIRAHAMGRNWDGMRQLAKNRGSRIGYRHFAAACIAVGDMEEALEYAMKVNDREQRLDFFIRMDEWQAAADLALEIGPAAVQRLLKLKELPGPVREGLVQRHQDQQQAVGGGVEGGVGGIISSGGEMLEALGSSYGASSFGAATSGLLSRMSVWGRG